MAFWAKRDPAPHNELTDSQEQPPVTIRKAELKIMFTNGGSTWFTKDWPVECEGDPADFKQFMNWLRRPRGPKQPQDGFFMMELTDGSTCVRHSTISSASIRYFDAKVVSEP